jgi:hypothetical protein
MIDATPLAALHEQVGNFLDEQRHAPSTLSHAVNHFFRQAFWAVSSPTMCRTC